MSTKRKLGKYELTSRLGKGGMAEVYKALQPGLDRFVAVKILHRHLSAEGDFIERFQREAQVIGRLQHSNILPLIDFDFDVESDEYYMVMDYIQGGTLEAYIKQHAPVPVIEALRLLEELADGTAYAHQCGMIHRDIKPANIMFMDQSFSRPLLTDFGLVRIMNDAITMTGAMIGTPAYMSPEAVRSEKVDGRADVYSLGVVLYELLTGRTPYVAKRPYEMMLKQLHEPMPSPREFNADIPQAVEKVVLKALEKEVDQRFQSAEALREALQETLLHLTGHSTIPHRRIQGASVKAVPSEKTPSAAAPAASSSKPSNALIGLAIGGVLLVMLLTVGLVWYLGQPEERSTTLSDITGNREGPSLSDLVAPISEAEAEGVGVLYFTDVNSVRLELKLAHPPTEHHYDLWLANSEEQEWRNLGTLAVEVGDEEQIFTASSQEPLIGHYKQALISIEPDDELTPSEISPQIAFRGEVSPTIITSLRHLMVEAETVTNKGFLVGAREQAQLAVEHGGFLEEALVADDLNEAKRHAEHLINILDGREGDYFNDYDNDGMAQNPGDDFGVRAYLKGSKAQAEQALQNASEPQSLQPHAQQLISACDNALSLVELIITEAQKLVATDSIEEAQPIADELMNSLEQLLTGMDQNNNGEIESDEGTILAAYDVGLQLGQIKLVAE